MATEMISQLQAARRNTADPTMRNTYNRAIANLRQATNDVQYHFAARHGMIPGTEGSLIPPRAKSWDDAKRAEADAIAGAQQLLSDR